MENITDLLSTIFVSKQNVSKNHSNYKEKSYKEKSHKEHLYNKKSSNIKSKELFNNDEKSNNVKSESSNIQSSNSKIQSFSNLNDSKVKSSEFLYDDSYTKQSIKSYSDSDSDSDSNRVSLKTSSYSNSSRKSSKLYSSDIKSNTNSYLEESEDKVSSSLEESEDKVSSSLEESKDKVSSYLEESEDSKEESVKSEVELKKIVLKAHEFYKRNILLVNDNNFSNIEILRDLLLKLNKMSELYDSSVHIFTYKENKKDFRDMILQQPDLYFNDLVIKTQFSIPKLESNKRHIFIIDYSLIENKLEQLLEKNMNAHIIIYHDNYSSELVKVYNLLGESTLLINKKDKLKILQSRFYSKLVKHLCYFNSVDDYLKVVRKDDNLKYLVIKNNELRYL
jgi:hypothetical protein